MKGGGRRPMSENGSKAPAKKAAGKAPAKATAPPKGTGPIKHISEMDLGELKARLNGKNITVALNGKTERIDVKNVTKLSKTEMSFTAGDGKQRVVDVNNIKKATR